MENYTFKKSTSERYDIRWKHGWAIFTIDENGGVFSCQSDHGNYNYAWPKHGRKSFKHFILELARDSFYFLGKVSSTTYLNYGTSLRTWKNTIIRMRKERDCTKEQAREVWDFIRDIDGCSSVETIQRELYGNKTINDLSGGEPWYLFDTDLDYPPGAVRFAKEVMPMFAEILQKELNDKREG